LNVAISPCSAPNTACDDTKFGGGCCIPGYVCAGVGCEYFSGDLCRLKAHLFRRYKFNVGYNDSGHLHFHSFRIINWKEYSNNYSSQYADIFNFVFFRAKHFHIRDWHSYRKSLRPSNKSYVKLDVDPGHRPLPNWILRMLGHTWRRVLQDIP
jgi:hypothetical protein